MVVCTAVNYFMTELGWKSFRHQLYGRQLIYYSRLLSLPSSRWASQAVQDHLSGGWGSRYLAYILRVRMEVGMVQHLPTKKLIQLHLTGYFTEVTNTAVSCLNLPALHPRTAWRPQEYVCELGEAGTIARVKLACVGLGNKAPRPGKERIKYCPLCWPATVVLSEKHVLVSCPSVLRVRRESGLSSVLGQLLLEGLSEDNAYSHYVTGLDSVGRKVAKQLHLQRGLAMGEVIEAWKAKC